MSDWACVSEILLLTRDQANAERFAQSESDAGNLNGSAVVTSRQLDKAGEVRVISVWKDGTKIQDFGPLGRWRKANANPL